MPILKHNRAQYPVNWEEISFLIRDANHWVCQECNEACRKPGDPYDHSLPELTISHYDNVYDAPEIFLACMCAKCHLIHDRPFRPQFRERNLRVLRRQAGQLAMLRVIADAPLSRAELAEFEAAWPNLDDLEEGNDIFREKYGAPTGGNL